jgi:hypothetical protein
LKKRRPDEAEFTNAIAIDVVVHEHLSCNWRRGHEFDLSGTRLRYEYSIARWECGGRIRTSECQVVEPVTVEVAQKADHGAEVLARLPGDVKDRGLCQCWVNQAHAERKS